MTIIHWIDVKLRYNNHYRNFKILINGENTTFADDSQGILGKFRSGRFEVWVWKISVSRAVQL